MTYNIIMTDKQVRLIHRATGLLLEQSLTPSVQEEVIALHDMTNPNKPDLYPMPNVINGWAL